MKKQSKTTTTTTRKTAHAKTTAKQDKTPTNAAPFAALVRAFETGYTTDPTNAAPLYDLAAAVAFATLRKVIDPQRKAAADRETVSNSGVNPALVALRRGINHDLNLLDATAANAAAAFAIKFNQNGDCTTEIADKGAYTALVSLIGETLSDGMDLVQAAAVALLEQAADHADPAAGWMEKPYTVRRLSKKVYTRLSDSAAYKEEETTPIQEIYKAVRREIANSRAIQTDPRNGYTYLEEETADGVETIYRRLMKYADLGGYAVNGDPAAALPGAPAGIGGYGDHYTADRETVMDYEKALAALSLTDRQLTIVRLRMQGKGYKQIATYLGLEEGNVKRVMRRLRDKCAAIGFAPAGYTPEK